MQGKGADQGDPRISERSPLENELALDVCPIQRALVPGHKCTRIHCPFHLLSVHRVGPSMDPK